MDYKVKAEILRSCSSKKGERCSSCPALGQGDQHCRRNAMKDGAQAINELLSRAEKAEKERDAAVLLCGKLIALCSPPQEWKLRLFRRHINRAGDYMGCGYDFLDEFNRIYNEFIETADDEIYEAIISAAENEQPKKTEPNCFEPRGTADAMRGEPI